MTQSAVLFSKVGDLKVELPAADLEVLPGVRWGAVDAFPAPAYWYFQALNRRVTGEALRYRLGRSLIEELGACLLGGHGIPAEVGVAAYARLREVGCFDGQRQHSADEIFDWLSQPLAVNGRHVRYRFAAQKARYLAACLPIVHNAPKFSSGRALRDWLLVLPGVGPKTASWIARNWMDADDVAILDIHILRFGQAVGLFDGSMKVEKDYLKLESLFLEFSKRLDVKPSELDAVIWYEMAMSPKSVRALTQTKQVRQSKPGQRSTRRTAQLELV
jgi:thermostable 8-oxoguanine DNA glycosylase